MISSDAKPLVADPESIAVDIEATRARIDRTVHALAARLSPQGLLHTASDAGRASLSQAYSHLQRAAHDNPVPLGVSAATAMLLVISSRRSLRTLAALARERPFLMGAASAGIGALLGLAFSRSRVRAPNTASAYRQASRN